MASKRNYSRYFIILQEDEKGYVLDKEKNSSGYVKLEKKNNKCKVSFYAQNINPGLEPYYMILICKDRDHKKLLVLGKLNINEQGKIDMNCDYDINNIANSRMSMQHIIGATIGKVIDKDIISLMSGFISSDIPRDWTGYEVVKIGEEEDKSSKEKNHSPLVENKQVEQLKRKEVEEEEKENQRKLDEEENNTQCSEKSIFEKYEESIEKSIEEENEINNEQNEVNNEQNIDLSEQIKNLKEELNDLKELNRLNDLKDNTEEDICSKNEFCTLQEDMIRKKKESLKCIDEEEYDKCKEEIPTGKVGEYFKKLVFECEKVKDMGDEIPNCVWYKILVNSLEDLYDSSQFDRYTIIYYPMICYYSYISQYKHFCIGYKCDKSGKLQYIIYAIPGLKDREYQPYGGRTGFVTWIPTNNNDDYGYWVMFYDFRKSSVVVPIKK